MEDNKKSVVIISYSLRFIYFILPETLVSLTFTFISPRFITQSWALSWRQSGEHYKVSEAFFGDKPFWRCYKVELKNVPPQRLTLRLRISWNVVFILLIRPSRNYIAFSIHISGFMMESCSIDLKWIYLLLLPIYLACVRIAATMHTVHDKSSDIEFVARMAWGCYCCCKLVVRSPSTVFIVKSIWKSFTYVSIVRHNRKTVDATLMLAVPME